MMHITRPFDICPLKGARAISRSEVSVVLRGLENDRMWMVVEDEQGMFVAQRRSEGMGIPVLRICLIQPILTGGQLILQARGMSSLCLPEEGVKDPTPRKIQIWKDTVIAADQGEEAAWWLREFLGRERPRNYRLVRFFDNQHRKSRRNPNVEVAFHDADSILMIGEASRLDLNVRMCRSGGEDLPMNRFRPGVTLTGSDSYAEDYMARVRIGCVEFEGTTLCVRCATTMVDQLRAVYSGGDPLTTLDTYRPSPYGPGVVFGRNFNHLNQGRIRVGDKVEVLAYDNPWGQ